MAQATCRSSFNPHGFRNSFDPGRLTAIKAHAHAKRRVQPCLGLAKCSDLPVNTVDDCCERVLDQPCTAGLKDLDQGQSCLDTEWLRLGHVRPTSQVALDRWQPSWAPAIWRHHGTDKPCCMRGLQREVSCFGCLVARHRDLDRLQSWQVFDWHDQSCPCNLWAAQ